MKGIVSIPFKRESVSKDNTPDGPGEDDDHLFQFPSNGKAYPKKTDAIYLPISVKKFQFPSNGKAYPK